MAEWPKPASLKQRHQFLTFAHFHHRFIRDYSQVTSPLTKLTSLATIFTWTPEADAAFMDLKRCFTSAPVLIHLDPSHQFIMELDASDMGVRAVLSQQASFNPTEQYHDIGNLELIAVKLGLQEWRLSVECIL